MKNFFILLFFIFNSNLAANIISPYATEKINKNAKNYNHIVIPQLKGMLEEFYSLLQHIDNVEGEIAKGRTIYNNYFSDIMLWQQKCDKVSDWCTNLLSSQYKRLRESAKQIIVINKTILYSESSLPDDVLKSRTKLIELETLIYQLLHDIEILLMTSSNSYFLNSQDKEYFYKKNHRAELIFDTLICRFVSADIRTDFELVWTNFFIPIDNYVLKTNKTEYLVDHLGELNILWNNFHLKLSKGNKFDYSSVSSQMNNIHNRWNSILRLYLAN